MRARGILGAGLLGFVTWLGLAVSSGPLTAQGPATDAALTGTVRSAEEGLMEGVLVSARRQGSTITTTVVTNAGGVYSFPRSRLEPGTYDVSIRAVGYVMAAQTQKLPADVAAGGTATLNMNLRPSNHLELALQLTDPEWFISYPLDDQTKFEMRDCSRCHRLRPVSMSTYDAGQMAWVLKRMVYSAGSSPLVFQLPGNQTPTWGRAEWGEPSPANHRLAQAIASINLSDGLWDYELKTMPRPTGKETQVIYTTWDLPVTYKPHDTRIGPDGWIWFNHFNDNAIGRLNPETGETQQWRWPYRGEEGSFAPTGARTLMGPDHKGRWYIGNQAQGGLVVFDPATETFEYPDVPGGGEMADVSQSSLDGHGWRSGPGAYKVNLETWEVTQAIFGPPSLSRYDIAADTQNNLYGAGRGSDYVWYVDAEAETIINYDIPESPRGVGGLGGGMRRGITDSQDRLWWGGFDGNFLGVVDRRKPAGEEVTIWPVPYPWFMPYDAHYDERGYTWTAGINADRVARFHPESGEWNFYLLPFPANIRDINLQPSVNGGPSGLWLGHNHEAKITLVEPLVE